MKGFDGIDSIMISDLASMRAPPPNAERKESKMDDKIKRTYSMIDYINGIDSNLTSLRKSITSLIEGSLNDEKVKVGVRVTKFRNEMNELIAERNRIENQLDARFKIFLNITETVKSGVSTYDLWLDDFDEWLRTQPDAIQELSQENAPIE